MSNREVSLNMEVLQSQMAVLSLQMTMLQKHLKKQEDNERVIKDLQEKNELLKLQLQQFFMHPMNRMSGDIYQSDEEGYDTVN